MSLRNAQLAVLKASTCYALLKRNRRIGAGASDSLDDEHADVATSIRRTTEPNGTISRKCYYYTFMTTNQPSL